MAAPADAQSRPEKQGLHAKRGAQSSSGRKSSVHADPRAGNGYVEYDADRMRFGSSAWWDQMRRQGRLGGETP